MSKGDRNEGRGRRTTKDRRYTTADIGKQRTEK